MKTIIRNIFLCFIISVFTISCEHSASTQIDSEQLHGSWQWVKTEGGFTGTGGPNNTPEAAGYTAKAIFKPEGIAQFFRNDTLINQSKYSIIKDTSHSQVINLLHLTGNENYLDQRIDFRGNDSLILSDNAMDGFYYFYIRIKN
ncbi:MAG: hypothetical protein M0P61_15585 [Ignavibacteriaceae bacterium]|jgi:hypothetical protein|nr:hypothetical protein [Ignavibacteriaceae bacterium]